VGFEVQPSCADSNHTHFLNKLSIVTAFGQWLPVLTEKRASLFIARMEALHSQKTAF